MFTCVFQGGSGGLVGTFNHFIFKALIFCGKLKASLLFKN
jgi:hypothetical protein